MFSYIPENVELRGCKFQLFEFNALEADDDDNDGVSKVKFLSFRNKTL